MIKFMLDTNICIFTIKNKPEIARQAFNQHNGQMSISAVTLMELIYGADTACSYRPVACGVSQSGYASRPYNAMIGAHARSLGLALVSNNTRKFARIPGLRLQDWTSH